MLTAGIDHVSLNVSDTARALEYYVGVLGMRVLERPDLGVRGAWLDAGGGMQIHLIEAGVPDDRGQHVALLADDLDAAVVTLRRAGCEVSEPKPVPMRGVRQCFTHDPDRNRIELTERR